MTSWWSEHPDLERTARAGRRHLIDDAAEAESDSEQLRRRRRSLSDVCFEWMGRGDLVTVAVGGHRFQGQLVAAVNDLVVMATTTLRAAVSVAAVDFVRNDRTALFAGTTGDRTATSFRAELGRYEVDGLVARLVGMEATFDVVGTITASSDDHVLLRDRNGLEWALARDTIAYATTTGAAVKTG